MVIMITSSRGGNIMKKNAKKLMAAAMAVQKPYVKGETL